MLAEAIAKTSFNDLEFRITTRANETKWMAVSWQPMYDDQQHHGFRSSVRDITERQVLKEQLRLYTEHLEQLVDTEIEQISSLVHQMYQLYKRNPIRPSELEVVTTVRSVLSLLDPTARCYRVDLQVQAPQTPVCAKLPEG